MMPVRVHVCAPQDLLAKSEANKAKNKKNIQEKYAWEGGGKGEANLQGPPTWAEPQTQGPATAARRVWLSMRRPCGTLGPPIPDAPVPPPSDT